jgi:hypothetical protein
MAVSAALLAVSLAFIFASSADAQPPLAANQNRIASYFPLKAVNGSPVDGVAGRLHVAKVRVATSFSAQDVFVFDVHRNEAQIGVIQGEVGFGTLNCHSFIDGKFLTTPHFFAGEAPGNGECEALADLGPAPLNRDVVFSLRRNNVTGRMYGFINGVQRWVSNTAFTVNQSAGVNGETNDSCSEMHLYAAGTGTDHRSLQVHTPAGGFQYWLEQQGPIVKVSGNPNRYRAYRPYGASTAVVMGVHAPDAGCR